MIVATPLFIDKLGVEQYGVWMFINSLVIALSFINIGGADTVIKMFRNIIKLAML